LGHCARFFSVDLLADTAWALPPAAAQTKSAPLLDYSAGIQAMAAWRVRRSAKPYGIAID
jgi:hypothetical protein